MTKLWQSVTTICERTVVDVFIMHVRNQPVHVRVVREFLRKNIRYQGRTVGIHRGVESQEVNIAYFKKFGKFRVSRRLKLYIYQCRGFTSCSVSWPDAVLIASFFQKILVEKNRFQKLFHVFCLKSERYIFYFYYDRIT